MGITAEQFYNTVANTSEAAFLDIPEKPAPEPEKVTPSAEDNKTEAAPNKEQGAGTPPAQEATPAATNFNFEEELDKASGGLIKTKDQIAQLLETSRKASELETQINTFRQENTQLKEKAGTNPFANDFTAKLDALYRSNANESQIQAFMAINKVDIDALSPLQSSSLALQIKHGLTPDEADRYIAKKYEIDLSDPTAVMDKDAEIALKIDSGVDREFLKTHKAEVSAVPADQSVQEAQLRQEEYTQKVTKLEPIGKEVVSDLLTNAFKGVSVNGKQGEGAITVDLPVSEESKTNLIKTVNDMIASNWEGLTPDDKGRQAIQTFAKNVLILQNYEAQLIDVASKTEMRIRAEYTNASPINRGTAAPVAGKTKEQDKADGVQSTLQKAGYL